MAEGRRSRSSVENDDKVVDDNDIKEVSCHMDRKRELSGPSPMEENEQTRRKGRQAKPKSFW